ncbi:MAG TPA: hypothetical protein VK760_14680 [Candidatus Acidoferrales bacterium]|jgi:hypothetical protein|nr:hypothetical protein [Candidatus Acidoferrales bacterium]
MLLSKEIAKIAGEMREESKARPYVRALMPEVVADESFWRMLIEIFEIVLHRHGYVVVRRVLVEEAKSAP